MTNVIGEDRSSFQAVSGWAGNYFGFAKATEGTTWSDPTFAANWAAIRAEGKARGAYHFFHPAEPASTQAAHFVATVKARGGIAPGDVFIADVEITSGTDGSEEYATARASTRAHESLRAGRARGTGLATTGSAALTFLQEVRALVPESCRVMLYTDLYMAQSVLANCKGYPLFIAAYASAAPASVHPWDTWTFWQTGAVQPGGGDQDYFHGTEAQLRAWVNPAPAPLPANWVYPPVQHLSASGGDTSVELSWDAPVQPAGQAPMPGIGGYEVAVTPGPELAGAQVASYPRFPLKGPNPQHWQGGSLQRKKQYTAGVRALDANRGHAGEWVTATFRTT